MNQLMKVKESSSPSPIEGFSSPNSKIVPQGSIEITSNPSPNPEILCASEVLPSEGCRLSLNDGEIKGSAKILPELLNTQSLTRKDSSTASKSSEEKETYKIYGYRWVSLISFFMILVTSGASYEIFVPFSTYMQDTYGISHLTVVLTSYIFHGIYPFSSFLVANNFVLKNGLKISLIIAITGMILCVWIRTLINQWVYFIIVASVLGALVDPFQGNLVAKVAATWFPESEQVAANTVGTLGIIIGEIVGEFYALAYFDTDIEDVSEGKSMVGRGLIYIAITYTVIYLICIIFFKSKPDTPPW